MNLGQDHDKPLGDQYSFCGVINFLRSLIRKIFGTDTIVYSPPPQKKKKKVSKYESIVL